MIVGYARTSTKQQEYGLEEQIEQLEKWGCEKIYREQVSSVYQREELELAIESLQPGDTLIVTKLDRLARSVEHFMKISNELHAKNVTLRILDLGLDTSSSTGKLILNIMASVAQFEREIMLERQRAGIERAKAEGKMKGRCLSPAAVKALKYAIEKYDPTDENSLSLKEISEVCHVSLTTVYAKLKEWAPDKITRQKVTQQTIIDRVFKGDLEAYSIFKKFSKAKREMANEIKNGGENVK